MLVLDPATGRYDVDATPETGRAMLHEHHAGLLDGRGSDLRGHAVLDGPEATALVAVVERHRARMSGRSG